MLQGMGRPQDTFDGLTGTESLMPRALSEDLKACKVLQADNMMNNLSHKQSSRSTRPISVGSEPLISPLPQLIAKNASGLGNLKPVASTMNSGGN